MTGAELRKIAVKAYGERGWQKKLATELGRDVSTVRRYAEMDEVPPMVALAVAGIKIERKAK